MDKGLGDRHVTWKSCDKSLERSRRIGKSLELELGLGVTSRDKGSLWCTHSVCMYDRDEE